METISLSLKNSAGCSILHKSGLIEWRIVLPSILGLLRRIANNCAEGCTGDHMKLFSCS